MNTIEVTVSNDTAVTVVPTGAIGVDGGDGSIWYTGAGVPSNGLGADGDFYLRSNGDYYGPKASGSWGSVVGSLKGADGVGAVDSVNGQTGTVVLDAGDVGADATGTAAGLVATEASTRGAADTANAAATAAHLADTVDAHDATAISYVPTGTVASSTVQAAIDEVASEYAAADAAHVAAADPHTGYQKESEKATAGGYASLDGSGIVPTSQLPSFVDEVLEYANLAAFPATGDAGKIYIALDTSKTYRWGGTVYVEIAGGVALGETSGTAYRGDRGKTAYDHSQLTSGNPHAVTKADVGLGSVDNTSDTGKPVSTAQAAADSAVASAASGALSAHTADTVDAHAASAISFTPDGSISATTVQAAIVEVRDEAAGSTDLSYTASTRVVASSTGTDATLTLADGTNPGLMSSAGFTKLAGIETAATADQLASEVPFTPTGTIAATNVQAAVAEVATEAASDLAAHTGDTVAAHAASAIAFTPNGTIAATDVQAAIQEVRDEAGASADIYNQAFMLMGA